MPIYVGTQKIDVSGMDKVYVGTQLVYQKNVPIVLSSITISGQTTSLNRGASFSFGGTVTAHYSNGSTANVTSRSTFSGYNMNTAGTYTVTVSYTEDGITKTATYSLTVNKVWTQIWSGTKTASNNATSVDVATLSSLSGTVTLRVTWSCSASGNSGTTTYYNNNGTTRTSTKPGSPFQFNLATGSNRNYILGLRRVNSNTTPLGLDKYLIWTSSSKKFTIHVTTVNSGAGGQSSSMTVTKIERYY